MSPSQSPAPDTDTIMSETRPSDMNQLKRKSLGTTPDPDAEERGEVPNKRAKVDDSPGRSPEPHGNGTHRNGREDKHGSPVEDVNPREKSQSPDTWRRRQTIDVPSSPDQPRRPSELKRRYNRSPVGPRDRRGSEHSRQLSSSHGADKDRDRRESYSQEEKKRGRRLFGGLLSTLSQTTANSQQKRRLEIEKKQQEKAVKQKTEDDKRRTEKLSKLDKIRKIEQIRFDEQVMRTRHSNMLAMAHSLRTKSEPTLYYRPWELTQEQERAIKHQIREAEDMIADEVRQFKRLKEQRLRDLDVLPASSGVDSTVVGEQAADERSNLAPQDESTTDDAAAATNHDHHRTHSPAPAPAPAPASKSSHHEDKDHDEMVEAEEDTVIY